MTEWSNLQSGPLLFLESTTMTFIALNHRTIIEISGADVFSFLQGMTTNDVTKLQDVLNNVGLYSAFLNPQGKFLNDAFIFRPSMTQTQLNLLWLDVEAQHAKTLVQKLILYKLRSNVNLNLRDDISIYAYFGESQAENNTNEANHLSESVTGSALHYIDDPRSTAMGKRVYSLAPLEFKLAAPCTKDLSAYDAKRIPLLIPDGARDIPYERGFIMEYGFDRLNAIDFEKGCYVGQELTARMYYRKLGKRQLVCMECEMDGGPEVGSDVLCDGVCVGTVRSRAGKMVLVHIKTEALETAKHETQSDFTEGNFTAEGILMRVKA